MTNTAELLIEIGTAEIPAIILPKLAEQLNNKLAEQLLMEDITVKAIQVIYTPRRIALIASDVLKELPSKAMKKKGPALNIAFDQNGEPTKACLGFAKSVNAKVADLHRGDKYVSFSQVLPSQQTMQVFPKIIQQLFSKIHGIKGMRWGELDDEFIRPVYWLMAIFDQKIIPVEVFRLKSNNLTYGHRVHGKGALTVKNSDEYIKKLEDNFVIVDQKARLALIQAGINKIEQLTGSICHKNTNLLAEVNNLIEYPIILQGVFDQKFLSLPKEVLETTIISHQKCFPLEGQTGAIYPGFIIVSNIDSTNSDIVIEGNQKVMQARLADAEFFYNSDIAKPIDFYLNTLNDIQMHNKLGSVYEQSVRISKLIKELVNPEDALLAERAGFLAKFDLATEMVGEFPELQGIVGYYYAKFYQENENVAIAIKEQYLPNMLKRELPVTKLGSALALSYRLDHLVGYFGVGIIPTGDNDPFALRRAAINIIKIILANNLDLPLANIIENAFKNYKIQLLGNAEQILSYILERLKGYYIEQGIEHGVIDSVILLKIDNLTEIDQRIKAVQEFLQDDFARDLAASNKRVRRILLKAGKKSFDNIEQKLMIEEPEKLLYRDITNIDDKTMALVKRGNFKEALSLCATLRKSVDNFFDNTLVMDKNEKIRNNRINLLFKLHEVFMRVADLSLINIEEYSDGKIHNFR